MSLYKRGGVWWSRIVRSGEVFARSTKQRNKADAIRVEAQWLVTAEDGNVALRRPDRTILARFETRFFDYIDKNVRSPKTRAYYKTHWIPLRESTLGGTWIQNITPAMIHDWVQARSEKVGASSVNGSLRTLRRALRLAQEWNVIKVLPRIRLVTGEHSREFVIDDELLDKMLKHERCTAVLKDLLPFLIDTGLRLGEAMTLAQENVKADGSLFVTKGKTKNARRTVPLTPRALAIAKQRTGERVFKESSFTVSHQFKLLRDALKLPSDCVLHSFRHSFCTRLGNAGASAFQIMRLAGHASVSVSQRYVHEDRETLDNAIQLLLPKGKNGGG